MKCTDCKYLRKGAAGFSLCDHEETPILYDVVVPHDFGCDFGKCKPRTPPNIMVHGLNYTGWRQVLWFHQVHAVGVDDDGFVRDITKTRPQQHLGHSYHLADPELDKYADQIEAFLKRMGVPLGSQEED